MTKTEQEKVERLELALRRIAYLRPAGPSRNKTVEDMERIALEALSSIAVAFHSPDPSADGGGGGDLLREALIVALRNYGDACTRKGWGWPGVADHLLATVPLASRTPAPGAAGVAGEAIERLARAEAGSGHSATVIGLARMDARAIVAAARGARVDRETIQRMRDSYAEPDHDGRTYRAVVRAFDLLLEQIDFAAARGASA